MDKAGAEAIERARAARAAGRLEEAAALYEQAASTGDPLARAHRLRHAGEIRLELGQVDRAEAALAEAVAGYRAAADPPVLDLANALRPLAMLREAQRRAEDARVAWREAALLYAEAGIEPGVKESNRRLKTLGA
jgi:tetratricopeptide (TPR) repeat protein